jgi:hypothetical protein
MTIASAVQRGSIVYIYGKKGQELGVVNAGGSRTDDGLQGYTGSIVTVRRGNSIYIYDEKGQRKGVRSAQ